MERLGFDTPRVHGERFCPDLRACGVKRSRDILCGGQFARCACQTDPDLVGECAQVVLEILFGNWDHGSSYSLAPWLEASLPHIQTQQLATQRTELRGRVLLFTASQRLGNIALPVGRRMTVAPAGDTLLS